MKSKIDPKPWLKALWSSLIVKLDTAGIEAKHLREHFKDKVASKNTEAEARNEMELLYNHFLVEEAQKSEPKQPEPTKKEEPLTEEERQKAEKLCNDPNILEICLIPPKESIIGEDKLLTSVFISICSGRNRKYAVSMEVGGTSGTAKNESIRAVEKIVPAKWVYAFHLASPEALKYMPPDFDGTILVYESESLQSGDPKYRHGSTSQIALRVIGEGEQMKFVYPAKPEGSEKFELIEQTANMTNFISTSSNIGVDPDLYRRIFRPSTNDDPRLTRRVCAKVMRDGSKFSFQKEHKYTEFSPRIIQCALQMLDWNAEVVVAPHKDRMIWLDYAGTEEQKAAFRTQIQNIMKFEKVLAILRQKNRVRFVKDGKLHIFGDEHDYFDAKIMLGDTLFETITRMEKRLQKVLDCFQDNIVIHDKHTIYAGNPVGSERSISYYLKTLADLGFLEVVDVDSPHKHKQALQYRKATDKPNLLAISKDANKIATDIKNWSDSALDGCLRAGVQVVLHPVSQYLPLPKFEVVHADTTETVPRKQPNKPDLSVEGESAGKMLADDLTASKSSLFKCSHCLQEFSTQLELD